MTKEILDAMHWRYATKVYDPSKKVSREDLMTILEAGRLAPSSIGLEGWKFIVVENPEIRLKLREAAYGQPKVTDATYIVVIARRTDGENLAQELVMRAAKQQGVSEESLDGLRKMAEGGVNMPQSNLDAYLMAQTYIPLGIMVETAALLKIDGGPMGGFDPAKVDEILGLASKNLKSTTMFAIGYRGEDPAATRPKVRREFDEVVEFVV